MQNELYNIPVIVKGTNSEFWQTIFQGSESYAKDNPGKVNIIKLGPKEESDVEEQVEILKKAISDEPDAIVLASTSNDKTVPTVESAMLKGIPVILIDNLINTNNYISFIATDNSDAAAKGAEQMVEEWKKANIKPDSKKVVVINSLKSSKVDQERDAGFINKMKELVPSIQVLDIQHVENDVNLTIEIVKDLISKNDDLIGIFADNDQTGIGVGQGISLAKAKDRVVAVAFDSSEKEIEALERGDLKALIVQDPFAIGYTSIEIAIKAIEDEEVSKNIVSDVSIVTKENINEESIQKLLYPKV